MHLANIVLRLQTASVIRACDPVRPNAADIAFSLHAPDQAEVPRRDQEARRIADEADGIPHNGLAALPDAGLSRPAHARQVALPPRLEHQQTPENLLVIPHPEDVIGHELADGAGVQEAYAGDFI
jgi:hypothetical protein